MRKLFFVCSLLTVLGCSEDPVTQAPAGAATPAAGPSRRDARKAASADEAKEEDALPPAVDFQESAFVESDRSRDPFRNFANVFVAEARGQAQSQREVVLEQYSVDQLKLVALVTGMHPARAMLIDPKGVGHTVTRGQYVGRATVVQPSGGVGAAYEVNWRVDRIRGGDVVLVRDDPANPEVPSSTRVIPLRTDDISAETATGASDSDTATELKEIQEKLARLTAEEAAKERQKRQDGN